MPGTQDFWLLARTERGVASCAVESPSTYHRNEAITLVTAINPNAPSTTTLMAQNWTASKPTIPERMSAGRALRRQSPRSSHGAWAPAADRPDPISLLQTQDKHRLQELLPIRYGRMLESPFAFLRGAAIVMAADLASTPRSGINVQLCGDAHLLNFGLYGTPERNLVFDINDFDETLPGPWEWDVKRLAASVMVAARSLGFSGADCDTAVLAAGEGYRQNMSRLAVMGNLATWYSEVQAESMLQVAQGATRRSTQQAIQKARHRDNLQAFSKLTTVVNGTLRIADDPPLITHLPDDRLGPRVLELLRGYDASIRDDLRALLRRYTFVDYARKVVGVGSVGTRCFIVLLVGANNEDPLLLQIKEACPSVLENHLPRSVYKNYGRRVVHGQHLMQAASDIFLGWGKTHIAHFYVRQLRDMKGSSDVTGMSPQMLASYAALCGWALARAHARTGDAPGIFGYLGNGKVFDQALVRFSAAYADQNERDYEELVAAVKSGRVQAETGV